MSRFTLKAFKAFKELNKIITKHNEDTDYREMVFDLNVEEGIISVTGTYDDNWITNKFKLVEIEDD